MGEKDQNFVAVRTNLGQKWLAKAKCIFARHLKKTEY